MSALTLKIIYALLFSLQGIKVYKQRRRAEGKTSGVRCSALNHPPLIVRP